MAAARPCSVCTHPKREEIEQAIKNGASVRGLAGTYDLSKTSLYRHVAHMEEKAKEREEKASGRSFEDKSSLDRINEVEKIARDLIGRAKDSGQIAGIAPLLRAANESLSIAAKLRGEMTGKAPEIVHNGPTWAEFHTFTSSLLSALDDQPEAKKAVLDALLSLPGGATCGST